MLIDQVMPQLVGGKSTLRDCLRAEGIARGCPTDECEALLAAVPANLIASECFLDKLTGLWRYEFGEPHQVGQSLIWGVHMWPPVPVLFSVLDCARRRLPPDKHAAYLAVLAKDRRKHPEYLAEMLPMLRVDPGIPADFEVAGRGVGHRTIDWVIGPAAGRLVMIDVKRRYGDLLALMGRGTKVEIAAPPEHNPSILFRSVEGKFRPADPAAVLQGAWVVTDIKQEDAALARAFAAMDAEKVHFAILGDAQSDATLLTRRPEDRPFLLDLFQVVGSQRYVFDRAAAR